MTLHFEVISRFQAAANADALLYTPLNAGLTFRRSRVYTVEINGDEQKAREYLLSVLVDPISQECTEQNAPILEGALFTIDYGMKAGALDLEKEAILQNYRGRRNMGFTLDGLKITSACTSSARETRKPWRRALPRTSATPPFTTGPSPNPFSFPSTCPPKPTEPFP